MANADELHLNSFKWNILNPFLPETNSVEAFFFCGSPTVTQWKVTLTPFERIGDQMRFSFSLEFVRSFDEGNGIIADSILVTISQNDALIRRENVRNYHFGRANWYSFSFQAFADIQTPPVTPDHVVVDIQILLSGRIIGRGIINGLIFNNDDLRRLSEDLRRLFNSQNYSNMILMAYGHPFRVHSYIMRARWDNFFRLHPYDEAAPRPLQVDIPPDLLLNLLVYMYSGEFEFSSPNWTDLPYTAQLFRVIDRYKLYHLYRVFVQNDVYQVRESQDGVLIVSHLFPIHLVNGRHVGFATYPWNIQRPDYGFSVILQLQNSLASWLAYYLFSSSGIIIYARVYLEVVMEVEPNVFQRVLSLQDTKYRLDPFTRVPCTRTMLLDSREIFGGRSASDNTNMYIRCHVVITNGIRVERILSADGRRQPVSERRLALSDAMYGLVREVGNGQDLTVSSHPQRGMEAVDLVHKAIFTTRVPEFWRGLEDQMEGQILLDAAIVRLSGEALPIVINYIYTGRVFPIPNHLLDEIEEFAEETSFAQLQDLVRRLRRNG